MGRFWNRLTPTRGAKTVAAMIAGISINGTVKIDVGIDSLAYTTGTKPVAIPDSRHYARSLLKAGVIEIELQKGVSLNETRNILNALASRKIEQIDSQQIKTIIVADPLRFAMQIFLDTINFHPAHAHPEFAPPYDEPVGESVSLNDRAIDSYTKLLKRSAPYMPKNILFEIAAKLRELGEEPQSILNPNDPYDYTCTESAILKNAVESVISTIGLE